MPARKSQNISVSPSKTRNGMQLRDGRKRKVSKKAKKACKKRKVKDSAEKAAAEADGIANLAAIEDKLAKAVKEAASAPCRRPEQEADLDVDSGQQPNEDIDLADQTFVIAKDEELLGNVSMRNSLGRRAIPTRQQNIIETCALEVITAAENSAKPKPRPKYGKKPKQAGEFPAGVASIADAGVEADILSVQTIKAINPLQAGDDTQGNSTRSAANTNFATKPSVKSKEPVANKKISQLELADETSKTDNSHADDMTSQTDDDSSQVDEDSEAPAGPVAASNNSISEAENVLEIMEKRKPNKKQPTQTIRDWILASRKEPSVKGFQRKATTGADVTCVATITAMSESLIPFVNETILFFHNRRFETPEVKKNASSRVMTWARHVLRPAPVQHLAMGLKPSSTCQSSISTSTSNSVSLNQGSSGTRICAVVTSSVTTTFPDKHSSTTQHPDLDDPNVSELNRSSMAYGSLGDDDDHLEQLSALASPLKAAAAAKVNKASIGIKPGLSSPVKVKESQKRVGNKSLPDGALDGGKWTVTFKQTFLKYLGGLNKNIWGLEDRNVIRVLQAIWIEVYKSDIEIGEKKVVYVVRKGNAVHKMAIQRATEWRNSLMYTAFYVINDFFDAKDLITTQHRQGLASDLLADTKYAFLRIKEVVEDGEKLHLIDTEDTIFVPGFIDDDDFPKAALALCATAVHRALWLWAEGHITYEDYIDAKVTDGRVTRSIKKGVGPDGKPTNDTNFSKDRWEEETGKHILDVWKLSDDQLQLIGDDTKEAKQIILLRKVKGKRKASSQSGKGQKRARGTAYTACVVSDSDF